MNKITPVPPGGHKLPPLPYALDALEPVIDAKTLQIHHDKHHKKYVDDLNRAELALAESRRGNNYDYIKYWENELAFNGSGHILHSIYWMNMTKVDQGKEPGEYTAAYINWYFGNTHELRAQFAAAAKAVEGSGWCILGFNPAFLRLEILQVTKHQNLTQWGIIPILVCDVWEHAYYLKHQNQRNNYVDQWWRLVNWSDVEARLIASAGAKIPIG